MKAAPQLIITGPGAPWMLSTMEVGGIVAKSAFRKGSNSFRAKLSCKNCERAL